MDIRECFYNGVRLRKLVKVPCAGSTLGYSFTFEAERNGEWVQFGPDCYGNWTVASYLTGKHIVPISTGLSIDDRVDPDTVPIGFWRLKDIWDKNFEPTEEKE